MIKFAWLLLSFALAASANGPQTITLNPGDWGLFCSGVPCGHPSALTGGGWFAAYPITDTPGSGRSLGYMTTNHVKPLYPATFVSVTLQVVATSGTPQFWGTDCGLQPVTVRLYFASGPGDGQRWWAAYPTGYPDVDAYYISPGDPVTLTIPLVAAQWKSVYGEFADSSPQATANWLHSMQHTNLIGITQGGQCNYGHGVNVTAGTAQIQVTELIVR